MGGGVDAEPDVEIFTVADVRDGIRGRLVNGWTV